MAHLVQRVVCQKRSAGWLATYRRVSRVLRQTVRASSAVEGMNSVLRMHQARHRTVTQELLDLKRLYWNSRPFREGAQGAGSLRTAGPETAQLRLLGPAEDAGPRAPSHLTQELSSSKVWAWDGPFSGLAGWVEPTDLLAPRRHRGVAPTRQELPDRLAVAQDRDRPAGEVLELGRGGRCPGGGRSSPAGPAASAAARSGTRPAGSSRRPPGPSAARRR